MSSKGRKIVTWLPMTWDTFDLPSQTCSHSSYFPLSKAYTSVQRSPLQLTDHKELAHLMNTISFHTKMVDFLDEMLNETSDMSFFCFYYKQVQAGLPVLLVNVALSYDGMISSLGHALL